MDRSPTIFLPSFLKTPRAMSTLRASQTLLLIFCQSFSSIRERSICWSDYFQLLSSSTSLFATSLQEADRRFNTISQARCDSCRSPFYFGRDFFAQLCPCFVYSVYFKALFYVFFLVGVYIISKGGPCLFLLNQLSSSSSKILLPNMEDRLK